MISESQLQNPSWDGSGTFEDGESEDYLLQVDQGPPPPELKFQQLPMDGVKLGPDVQDPNYWGHDELSTAYTQYDDPGSQDPCVSGYQGCYMADDFADFKHSPVIEVKWWGSYLLNEIIQPVNQFLIAFERDIPDDGQIPSHPGNVISTEIVNITAAAPNPGEYTKTTISSGGPPCNEILYEYKAVLANPFPQDPNTVYWIKIVAIVELTATEVLNLHSYIGANGWTLCEYLRDNYVQGEGPQMTRWGWHNRDYTIQDTYASTPPTVVPGEHATTFIDPISGSDVDVWHFQDDAVEGDVLTIDTINPPDPAYPERPAVFQGQGYPDEWRDKNYLYLGCGGSGVDGPEGIEQFSKDLAFELYTNDDCFPSTHPDYANWVEVGKPGCWCYPLQCHGDADLTHNGVTNVTRQKWVIQGDLDILLAGWQKKRTESATLPFSDYICASFARNNNGVVNINRRKWVIQQSLDILLANWQLKYTQLSSTVCP